jgi:hypothetical protein
MYKIQKLLGYPPEEKLYANELEEILEGEGR